LRLGLQIWLGLGLVLVVTIYYCAVWLKYWGRCWQLTKLTIQ